MKLAARIRSSLYAVALLATGAALPAAAAAQTVIGGGGEPDVIVDYSVLEQLGPRPNVPQVLMPPTRGVAPPPAGAPQPRFPMLRNGEAGSASGGIVLTPPRGGSVKPPVKPATRKARPQAPAKAAPRPKPKPPVSPAPRAPEPAAPPPAPPPPPNASAPAKAPPAPLTTKAAKAPEVRPAPPPPQISEPPAKTKAEPAPPPATAEKSPEPEPTPAPAPASATTPPPEPSEAKTASLAPTAVALTPIEPGQSMRVGFDAGSARLSADANRKLKRVAQGLSTDEALRIQLLSYAGGTETASQARRLSLSRALAARSFLIGEGVRSTRIDVRALGNKSEGGPPDRIDVIITKR